MTGAAIRVDVIDTASKALGEAIKRLDDPSELYSRIAKHLLASTQRRFETETDPDGNPWPKSVRAAATGGKTLRDKGNFYRSITTEIYDDGLAVGTNAIQGAIHQYGGVIKAKNGKGLAFKPFGSNSPVFVKSVTMPRRAYLGMDNEDERAVIEISEEYIFRPFSPEGG